MRFLILPLALAVCLAPAFAAEEGGAAETGIDCKCDAFSIKLEPKAAMDPAAAQLHQRTMLDQFDANKDGELSAEESEKGQWEATKSALLRCQEMRDQFDADDDGKLTDAEEAEFNKFVQTHADLKALICECGPAKTGMEEKSEPEAIDTSAPESGEQKTEQAPY